jgi:hypothetical protein
MLTWTLQVVCRYPTFNLCLRPPNFLIFSLRGGWPCLHHARFTEPLHSCRRGHNAFVQTEHLPLAPFCSMGLVLEVEIEGSLKVKVKGCDAIAWDNVGCWLGGGTGRDNKFSWSSAGEFSHPLSVINNVDRSCSLSAVYTSFSELAWMNCDTGKAVAALSFVAVLKPSNSSSSEKSSVVYEGQIQ